MNNDSAYFFHIRRLRQALILGHKMETIQSMKIERVQKICLRIILAEMYVSYDAALEMSGLDSLESRREQRCLNFAKKCLKNSKHMKLFPENPKGFREKYVVNFAKTETYKKSSIPYMQRLLNTVSSTN